MARASAPPELDRDLIERASRHEPAACRALIGRYQGPVGQLLRRLLGPAGLDHLTEDLAQETMLRAFGALPRFDPEGPATLSTWILKIATRLGINELKRRRPPIEVLTTTAEELPGGEAADDRLHRAAIAEAITEAVARLPADFRAAFLLREYHGLGYAEIATMLELRPGTLKSRLSRARMALRETLEQLHAHHQEPGQEPDSHG